MADSGHTQIDISRASTHVNEPLLDLIEPLIGVNSDAELLDDLQRGGVLQLHPDLKHWTQTQHLARRRQT